MRTPHGSLLLLIHLGAFLAAASAVCAKPLRHPHYPVAVPSNQQQQQQLVQPATPRQYSPPHQAAQSQRRDQPHHPHQPGRHSSGHLDAAPNSVGLLLTTANHNDDDAAEVLHVWLPLGRRVYTLTSRITTMIRSTPRIATPEHLENILCRIYPHYNLTAEELDGSRVV
ncbi:hypothetical protein LTS09_008146 [Friedmanniomyces endolithicus]|nr:hypothetical protein LTS09_008146 [Friedmanniomyces endolithicus]